MPDRQMSSWISFKEMEWTPALGTLCADGDIGSSPSSQAEGFSFCTSQVWFGFSLLWQTPDRLREEELILANVQRSQPTVVGRVRWSRAVHIMADRKWSERTHLLINPLALACLLVLPPTPPSQKTTEAPKTMPDLLETCQSNQVDFKT